MSELYKQSFRGYLVDHHSPQPPIVTLDQLSLQAYERFFQEAQINHLMVYCKDHWGVTYYDTKLGQRHLGLTEDWVARLIPILRKNQIEFNAYYCLEYDNYAATTHPEWRILQADGEPLTCASKTAPWKMVCYETPYRAYVLGQLKEIVSGYAPDSLFLDIFGKSLCYCKTCQSKFQATYGYGLPDTEEGLMRHGKDVVDFLDQGAKSMLEDILVLVKGIDPTLKVTINFAALYTKEIRDLLDYQFTEPWAGNWLSAAYARDTGMEQSPQLGPGDVSEVYNYQPESIYQLAAAQIVAQGCRVFMYSGSQHPDGTLEYEEARRIGQAYKEVKCYEPYLSHRKVIADIGIIQSDLATSLNHTSSVTANAITRVRSKDSHKLAVLGAMKLCDYIKHTWQVIPEQSLTDQTIHQYKMLLLPSVHCIQDNLKELLEKYVQEGGILISDGQSGLYDCKGNHKNEYALANLYGCHYIGEERTYKASEWGSYLKVEKVPIFKYLPDTWPPIGSIRQRVHIIQAKVLARFINPATPLTNETWVNWWSPPPATLTDEPALMEHQLGKGRVVLGAFDLFAMENQGFHWMKDFMKGMAEHYIVKPKLKLITPTPNLIGMVGYERLNKEELLIHIVAHTAELTKGSTPKIPVGVLKIHTNYKGIKEAKCIYPVHQSLKVVRKGAYYEVVLPDIEIHQIILLSY